VVAKIIYLRQNYHFGPHRSPMCLKRYHDITICPSTMWRIQRRLEMSRLPNSQRSRCKLGTLTREQVASLEAIEGWWWSIEIARR
jgi:hypothetical protein